MPALPALAGRAHAWLWRPRPAGLPPWRLLGLTLARLGFVLARDLARGELTLRAQSLVYTTLLSLVPLLAVSFALLKGFGVHNLVEPALVAALDPLGEQGRTVAREIVGFVDNMKVGTLGLLGLGLLFYNVISVMQKIERAFNYAWRVADTRSLAQRVGTYVSTLVLGPVLVVAAVGLSAALFASGTAQSVAALPGMDLLLTGAGRLLPLALLTAAFAFIYVLMPNTSVRWSAALAGALVAALAWQVAGWLFARFVADSGQYAVVYSAFAGAIVFMLWLYVAWLVLLAGASVAFYVQHPEYLATAQWEPRLGTRQTERLALTAAARIAAGFEAGAPGWTLPALARTLRVPAATLAPLLEAMERAGVLEPGAGEPPTYRPARPPDRIAAADVLRAVRSDPPGALPLAAGLAPSVESLALGLERTLEGAAGATLRDLADQVP